LNAGGGISIKATRSKLVREQIFWRWTMATNLAVYLHDHLAGAHMAVEVLELLYKHGQAGEQHQFLATLLTEVKEDPDTLVSLTDDVAHGASVVKNSMAWLAAEAIALKLKAGVDEFGHFEAFEFLVIGILAKRHLWIALQQISPVDRRVASLDLEKLIQRAEWQYSEVEHHRAALAKHVLSV